MSSATWHNRAKVLISGAHSWCLAPASFLVENDGLAQCMQKGLGFLMTVMDAKSTLMNQS